MERLVGTESLLALDSSVPPRSWIQLFAGYLEGVMYAAPNVRDFKDWQDTIIKMRPFTITQITTEDPLK